MEIIYLCQGFSSVNNHGIDTDLIRAFDKHGHSVTVVSVEWNDGDNYQFRLEHGIKVLRIKVGQQFGAGFIQKGLVQLFMGRMAVRGIKKYLQGRKFDLILCPTPPVTFSDTVKYLKRKTNAKCYLLLKDIFPQNAVDLGLFSKKSPLYFYFRQKEKQLYRLSDEIGCMSQANVEYILKHNPWLEGKRVEVCPNTIEPAAAVPCDVEETRNKYGLPQDKTVFIYGGNLGLPQDIPFLLECLRSVPDDAFFVIVGEGTEYEKIEAFLELENPEHLKLIPRLSSEDYAALVSACDVGLIFLSCRFTIPNYPSRILVYMEHSLPVIACTDKNTDIGKHIVEGEFGFWSESSNSAEFMKQVATFTNDSKLRRSMGEKAREYLELKFTSEIQYDIINASVYYE